MALDDLIVLDASKAHLIGWTFELRSNGRLVWKGNVPYVARKDAYVKPSPACLGPDGTIGTRAWVDFRAPDHPQVYKLYLDTALWALAYREFLAVPGRRNGCIEDHRLSNLLDDRVSEEVPGAEVVTTRSGVGTARQNRLRGAYPAAKGYRGDKAWRAIISIKGKKIFLGAFDTELEAHAAYVGARVALASLGMKATASVGESEHPCSVPSKRAALEGAYWDRTRMKWAARIHPREGVGQRGWFGGYHDSERQAHEAYLEEMARRAT